MISFRSFNLLIESFKDAKRLWTRDGADPEQVDEYIKKFRALNDKNRIDAANKDIGVWMSRQFNSFVNFIDDMEVKSEQQTNYRGLDDEVFKIWDNKFSYCIVPKTHRASNKLGSSNWCIVYGQGYWHDYIEVRGLTPYYIIFKEKADIINKIYDFGNYDISAVAVMVDTNDDIDSIWDNDDHRIEDTKEFIWEDDDEKTSLNLGEIFEKYGLDLDDWKTFKSRVQEDDPVPQEFDQYELDPYFEEKDHNGEIGSHEYESRYINAYADLAHYYEENQTEYPIDSETLENYLKSISIGYTTVQHLDISKLGDMINRTPSLEEIKYIKDIYEDFADFCENDIYREDEEYTYTLDY
jgi:hypothetical protein